MATSTATTDPALPTPLRRQFAVLTLAGLSLFVFLSLPRLFQIAGQDEILHYVRLGEVLYQHGFAQPADLITFSPHLYGFVLWGSHCLLGEGIVAARVPGLVAWCLAAVLMVCWLRRQTAAAPSASWAWPLLLLATLPLALQAAAIVDIDNTVLVPAILALTLGVVGFTDRPGRASAAGVAAMLALALWCRVTTPTILIPVFVGYAWLRTRRWSTVLSLTGVLLLGAAIFLLTWGAYCLATGVHFAGPFRYFLDALSFCTVGEQRGIRPGKVALTLIYLGLWVGPGMVVLWALLAAKRCRCFVQTWRAQPVDALLLAGLAVLAGYCLIGGTIFGFPKYHCPAVPLLLLATAATFPDALRLRGCRGWFACLFLVFAGAVIQVAVLHDPLHVLRVATREAALAGSGARQVTLTGLVVPLSVTVCLGAILLALACRRRTLSLPLAVCAMALGMNSTFALTQLVGGYQTGYNYGDRGDAQDVAAFLQEHLPAPASAIVPGEIVYLLDRAAVRHVPNELWLNADALRQELNRPDVHAVAISLLTHTVEQVRTTTQTAAACPGYVRHDIGRYAVFIKTSGA